MRKSFLASMIVVTFLSACATKDALKPQVAAPLKCTWPGTSQEAPSWTCDSPVEGVAVSAVGIYEKTAAGIQFQKDQATASARVALAQQMRVHVANMVKQYAETTGAGTTETVDRVNSAVSKLVTSESLEGSRIYMSTVSPSGTMYVLVGLDPKLAARNTEQVLKTSMNNEKALWQQFKAKLAQDELAAAIANAPDSKK